MRRIALINQKGGVGKTTTTANLGAALAAAGRRVVLVDLDPQANLSMHLGVELEADAASTYSVLVGRDGLDRALVEVAPRLGLVPSHLDLSGAEMELAGAIGRESLLRDALDAYEAAAPKTDYVLIDCPPSLGLLSVNGLVAAREAFITLQTEFFALQGMSKLVGIVQLLRQRLNPELEITGILPCLYDPRLRLAREVLGEIRKYFPGQVFRTAVRTNVKLAEAPSFGQTIFQYAPESHGARDYREVAREVLAQEAHAEEGLRGPGHPEAERGRADEAGRQPQGDAATPDGPPPAARAPEPAPAAQPTSAASPGSAVEPAAPAPAIPPAPPEGAERPAAGSDSPAEPGEALEEEPASPGRDPRGQEKEPLEELILVPGKGLVPADRARPRPAPRAADLPPLPEDAFRSPPQRP